MSLQQTVRGSRAHREEQATLFFVQLEVPIRFQGFDDAWQERDQAFRANPVERLPGQHQRLFHFWPIAPAECSRRRQDLLAMVEQPLRIFAHIPGGGHKLSHYLLLLGPQRPVIHWRNPLEQDPSRLRPQSVSHVFLLSVKRPESDATDPLPLPHAPLPFVGSIAREYGFSQGSLTGLRSRGSVFGSLREKGNGDRQRKILVRQCVPDKRCHAHFLALLAKDVTCKFGSFGKKCCVLLKAGFPEIRAL